MTRIMIYSRSGGLKQWFFSTNRDLSKNLFLLFSKLILLSLIYMYIIVELLFFLTLP